MSVIKYTLDRKKIKTKKFKNCFFKICKIGVWFGFTLALAGSFEQALANGNSFWSSVAGFPFLHHYLYGFLILGFCMIILEVFKE